MFFAFSRIIGFRPVEEDMTYDRNQVIVTKISKDSAQLSDDQKRSMKGSNRHFHLVHDGQHRLITIFLLLVALFHEIEERLRMKIFKSRLPTFRQWIIDLSNDICPTDRKSGDRNARIVCNSPYLGKLVEGVSDVCKRHDGEEVLEARGKKARTEEEDPVPLETHNLMVAYDLLSEGVKQLDNLELEQLCDKTMEKTSMLVVTVGTVKNARRLVMSQRHGLDIEDVDYCKRNALS